MPLVAFACALLVLVLRRPSTLIRPEFWADDGHFYEQALTLGVRSLWQSYAGYLSVIQRGITLLELAVSPVLAPLVGGLAIFAVIALVAAFLASSRMAALVPDARLRLGLVLVFVLLPESDYVVWTASMVQWVTSIYLVALLVATPPTTPRGRVGDALLVVMCGLSGPVGLFVLPLYVVRALRDRRWAWHAVWLAGAVVVQGIVLFGGNRVIGGQIEWGTIPEVLAIRTLAVPLVGPNGPTPTLALAALISATIALALWRLPHSMLAGAAYLAVVIPLAGMISIGQARVMLDPGQDGRFFYITGFMLVGLIYVALTRRRVLAIPAAVILVGGMLANFQLTTPASAGWAESASCIGGPEACVVPVAPASEWSVHWPGQ